MLEAPHYYSSALPQQLCVVALGAASFANVEVHTTVLKLYTEASRPHGKHDQSLGLAMPGVPAGMCSHQGRITLHVRAPPQRAH
jgi:hypothetical protein